MITPRQLGESGLRVSPLCLGSANFGWVTDEATAWRMMDRALDEGVSFLDTADIYNRNAGTQASELIIGRWLSEQPGRRQRTVIATKVFGTTGDGANDAGLSARHIMLACEDSLRRLRTDWIDLYTLHHVDRSVPWDETWEALSRLIAQGKILYVGSSNFAAWQLTGLHVARRARGLPGLVSEQSPYSLAKRWVELEVLPACRHFGLGLLAYSPLDGGLLAGGAVGLRRDQKQMNERRTSEANRLHSWYACCADQGLDPPTAALAWVLAQPGVAATVIGPRTEEQLVAAIGAASVKLSEETAAAIAAYWPGPGTAPEAYAW